MGSTIEYTCRDLLVDGNNYMNKRGRNQNHISN